MDPVVDLAQKTVTHAGTTYVMQALADDSYTILVKGVPVGRAVFSFGAANVAPEGDGNEETLSPVAEAWFAALDG